MLVSSFSLPLFAFFLTTIPSVFHAAGSASQERGLSFHRGSGHDTERPGAKSHLTPIAWLSGSPRLFENTMIDYQ
jgi:hypothetical protein